MQDERDFQAGLANLSHDIRTPLAGAKGYLQLALIEDDPTEKDADILAASKKLTDMQTLLDQLFDYTRSESTSTLQIEDSVDVLSVLASCLAGFFPQFEEKGFAAEVDFADEALFADVDPEALRRIFDNVIQNALAHGKGNVRIFQSEKHIMFNNALSEDGAPDPSRVFERFYRASPNRSTTGAGLGLSVVKSLCDAMGIKCAALVDNEAFMMDFAFSHDDRNQ